MATNNNKKKRKYTRKCGVCGMHHEQSDMARNDGSPTGWLCFECYKMLHPEMDLEEW